MPGCLTCSQKNFQTCGCSIWRDAKMALRWTAASMCEAAKGFRRLKAHKQLPILKAALLKHRETGNTGVDQSAQAA